MIAVGDSDSEHVIKRLLLKKHPRYLLGSVPMLFSWEFTPARNRARRAWSGIINSFLHPTMERFLCSAEHRLRDHPGCRLREELPDQHQPPRLRPGVPISFQLSVEMRVSTSSGTAVGGISLRRKSPAGSVWSSSNQKSGRMTDPEVAVPLSSTLSARRSPRVQR